MRQDLLIQLVLSLFNFLQFQFEILQSFTQDFYFVVFNYGVVLQFGIYKSF